MYYAYTCEHVFMSNLSQIITHVTFDSGHTIMHKEVHAY